MKVAIVDDEVHCVESLVLHLKNIVPEAEIVFKDTKPENALKFLPEIQPDLLFLDIEMPGMNGFELLDQLPKYTFDVIFTTAYSQYVMQAYKANALQYLLKPIDDDELKATIMQWKEKKRSNKTRK